MLAWWPDAHDARRARRLRRCSLKLAPHPPARAGVMLALTDHLLVRVMEFVAHDPAQMSMPDELSVTPLLFQGVRATCARFARVGDTTAYARAYARALRVAETVETVRILRRARKRAVVVDACVPLCARAREAKRRARAQCPAAVGTRRCRGRCARDAAVCSAHQNTAWRVWLTPPAFAM